MRKYTKRQIKDYIRSGLATDITALNFSELKEWRNGRSLEKIGYASGVYGIADGRIVCNYGTKPGLLCMAFAAASGAKSEK